ncbi:MAG: hypothetical protein IPM36_16825 [Lewinellaceae bacterium]|nr:hypothetical protein [Lewinellaceae bacterium]
MKKQFSLSAQAAQPIRGPVFQKSLASMLSLTGAFPAWLFLFWRFLPYLHAEPGTPPSAQSPRGGTLRNTTTQTGINGWFIAYSQGNIREGPD